MPVIASAKSRRQFMRRRHIRLAVQDMADLVWKFLVHTGKGEPGKPIGCHGIKLWNPRRGCCADGQEKNQAEESPFHLFHYRCHGETLSRREGKHAAAEWRKKNALGARVPARN